MLIPIEAVVMLLVAVVGATVWIVSSINGVKDAINAQSAKAELRFQRMDDRIGALEIHRSK